MMKDTLAIAVEIWGPIILVIGIFLITILLYLPGVVLQEIGKGFVWVGGWLQAKLEDQLSRML